MTDGDLVTAPWQFEIRGQLHGPGSPFTTTPPGWGGLGLPGFVTPNDVDLDQQDGTFLGPAFYGPRILTFPVTWHGTPAEVMTNLTLLGLAWRRSTDGEKRLTAWLPGWGKWYVLGEPRGLVEDLSRIASGEGAALLTFHCGPNEIRLEDGRMILHFEPSQDAKVGFLFSPESGATEFLEHVTGDPVGKWAPSALLPESPTDEALEYVDSELDEHDQGEAGVLWVSFPTDLGTVDLFVWGSPDAVPGEPADSKVWAYVTSAAIGSIGWVSDGWLAAP